MMAPPSQHRVSRLLYAVARAPCHFFFYCRLMLRRTRRGRGLAAAAFSAIVFPPVIADKSTEDECYDSGAP